jgi:prenyltransferase beta subunit
MTLKHRLRACRRTCRRVLSAGWLLGSAALALVWSLGWASLVLADAPGAVAWLQSQQNADGGFGSPESSVGATADVLLAVASAGDNAIGWAREGKTALAYLEANAGSIAKAGDGAKAILGLVASGKNPRDVGGVDLVAWLEGMIGADGKIGGDSDFINEHCFAMLALRSTQRTVPAEAIDYLLSRQLEDGTWSWNGDTTPGSGDNNTAAIAVVALIAAGVPADNPQIQKTLAHFKSQQNEDGGFPYVNPSPYGTDSDSNSTAVVMWALKAAGEDPAGADWKYQGQDGHSALDRLRAFQNESGAFRWQDAVPADNLASTVQALIALEMKTIPFATMDVGTPAATAAETPEALPVTGGSLWIPVLVLLGGGAALVATGLRLRMERARRP